MGEDLREEKREDLMGGGERRGERGGKGSQQGQGDKILGRRSRGEGISTGGKDLGEEKGEDLTGGEKALGGKGEKGSQQAKGGKEDLGKKCLRGERGGIISTGKGVEKILGRKGRRSGGKKANRERGEKIIERRREKLSGGGGGKGLRGERVGRISGKGGKK